MDQELFEELGLGDVIKAVLTGDEVVVLTNYGGHKVAGLRLVVDIVNPQAWELVGKKQFDFSSLRDKQGEAQ